MHAELEDILKARQGRLREQLMTVTIPDPLSNEVYRLVNYWMVNLLSLGPWESPTIIASAKDETIAVSQEAKLKDGSVILQEGFKQHENRKFYIGKKGLERKVTNSEHFSADVTSSQVRTWIFDNRAAIEHWVAAINETIEEHNKQLQSIVSEILSTRKRLQDIAEALRIELRDL